MPTIKPELSEKSKYWIPKHRFYELKHFCLQYPHWKELYNKLDGEIKARELNGVPGGTDPANPTEKLATIRADCWNAMTLVDQTCKDAAPDIWTYLAYAVTEDVPFHRLQTVNNIPCGKDYYYDCYRRFFYMLSQRRGI